MYLYSVTLNQTSAISQSIYGSFTGPNQHELVVQRVRFLRFIGLTRQLAASI